MFQKIKASCTPAAVIRRLFASVLILSLLVGLRADNFVKLSYGQELSLILVLVFLAEIFAAFSAIAILFPKLPVDSCSLLLSASLCAIRWMTDHVKLEQNLSASIFLLVLLLFYGVVLWDFVNQNRSLLEKLRLSNAAVLGIALGFTVLAATVLSVVTCLRYLTFNAPGFDFGIFAQMFHNMKTTGLPVTTCERDVLLSHFAVHFSPIYYVVLPIYCIFSSPLTLQILQSVIIFSGIVPLYLLCRQYSLSNKTTAAVCVIFALYPALSCGGFYDFHENCFLVPLLLWMFCLFEKQKVLPAFLAALGVLMVKEDASVYIAFFGIYIIFARKQKIQGLILLVLSLGWFFVVTKCMNSTALAWNSYYESTGDTSQPVIAGIMSDRFKNLIYNENDGLFGAIKTLLVNPGYVLRQLLNTSKGDHGKILYLMQLFLPLGMLPFCSRKPVRWLLLAPLLMNLLTMYPFQYAIRFHYSFGIIVFLFYAAIQNLPEMRSIHRQGFLSFAMAACMILYGTLVIPKAVEYVKTWQNDKISFQNIQETLDSLPEDASLNISTHLLAHVANRSEVYELAYHDHAPDVDYVVIQHGQSVASAMEAYLAAGYTVVDDPHDKLVILKRPEKE